MSQNTTINGAAFQMDYAADHIQRKYEADGYQTQKLTFNENGAEGVVVQIRNTSDGWGSFLKKAVGCATCATLKMKKNGTDLDIEVGAGKWLDKSVVLTISMFVLWPLTITSGVGFYKQNKLLNQVYLDTLGFFAGSK